MARITRETLAEHLYELTKDELKEIARMFGLPVSGTKDELVSRILSNTKPSELAKVLGVGALTKQKKKESKTEKAKAQEIDASKLFKEIVKLLKSVTPPKVKNEDELELYFLGLLQGRFYGKRIEVVSQTVTVSKGKTTQPDIVVGGVVAIELKYIRGSDDSDRGIGQAVKYASTYPYVVLYYYDPQKRSHHSRAALGSNIELIVYPE